MLNLQGTTRSCGNKLIPRIRFHYFYFLLSLSLGVSGDTWQDCQFRSRGKSPGRGCAESRGSGPPELPEECCPAGGGPGPGYRWRPAGPWWGWRGRPGWGSPRPCPSTPPCRTWCSCPGTRGPGQLAVRLITKNTDQTIPCTVAFGIQANAIKIFSLLLRVPNETAK